MPADDGQADDPGERETTRGTKLGQPAHKHHRRLPSKVWLALPSKHRAEGRRAHLTRSFVPGALRILATPRPPGQGRLPLAGKGREEARYDACFSEEAQYAYPSSSS